MPLALLFTSHCSYKAHALIKIKGEQKFVAFLHLYATLSCNVSLDAHKHQKQFI